MECKYCGKEGTHYCDKHDREVHESENDFFISAAIGALTGSALIGGIVGGDFVGGIRGDAIADLFEDD